MTEILAIGTSDATSSDFTLTGESTSLLLTTTSGVITSNTGFAEIQVKNTAGLYLTIGRLDSKTPMLVLSAPGIYRVSRTTGGSCGVDRS